MPRIARAVAPGYPHHITQQGNNHVHLLEKKHSVLTGSFLDERPRCDYVAFVQQGVFEEQAMAIRAVTCTERPYACSEVAVSLEVLLDRPLQVGRPGRPRREQ